MFALELVLFLFFQSELFTQLCSKSNCFVHLLQTYRQRFSKISQEKVSRVLLYEYIAY